MSRANPRFHRSNPPLFPVGTTNGVVQYVVQGSIEGQMTLSTFMYVAAVPLPSTTQLTTLLTNISAGLFVAYKNLISGDWTTTQELLKVVHRNDVATVISTARAGTVGGTVGAHAPTEIAGIFIRQTPIKGQHGRGRVSIPAIPSVHYTASNWSGVGLAALQSSFMSAALATASDGTNTWTPCVGQRGTASPRLVTNYATISSWRADLLLGTIRRRKVGRGK